MERSSRSTATCMRSSPESMRETEKDVPFEGTAAGSPPPSYASAGT